MLEPRQLLSGSESVWPDALGGVGAASSPPLGEASDGAGLPARESEPGIVYKYPITPGAVQKRTLGTGDEHRYEFTNYTAGNVGTISLADTALNNYVPKAALYSPSWTHVGADVSAGSKGRYTLNDTGTYTIVISEVGANDTGEYALALEQLKPAPTTPYAETINYGDLKTGSVVMGEIKAYTFAATTNDVVTLSVGDSSKADGFSPSAMLYAPSGKEVKLYGATTGSLANTVAAGKKVLTKALTETGTYVIQVFDNNYTQVGSYALALERLKTPPPDPPATKMLLGDVKNASIEALGDVDTYYFTASTNDVVTLSLSEDDPGADTELWAALYAPSGVRVEAPGNDEVENGKQLVYPLPETGTYVVQVYDYDYTHLEDYGVAVEGLTPVSSDALGITVGGSQGGSISVMGEVDAYSFSVGAGTVVRLELTADTTVSYKPQAVLYTSAGVRIGDVSAGQEDTYTLTTAGTYVIQVRDLDFTHTGNYVVKLNAGSGPTPPTATLSASNITTSGGATHTFTVTYSDDVAIDVSDLGNADIRVTGPAGYDQLATFVSVNVSSDGTPRVATYQINAPGGTWDTADNGTYTVAMQASQVSDTSENMVPAGTLGTFSVNIANTVPTATVTVADVTLAGGPAHTFTVTYSDDVAIDVSDLDNTDIQVTGPAGYSQLATFVSVNVNSDGTPRIGTYRIIPPGGSWDVVDNGTYTVAMLASQVSDTSGNFVPAGALDTFSVNIDDTVPTATLTVADVTLEGGTTHTFTVTYNDNVAIDVSDLDSADIRVTGPAGYNQLATFVSVNVNSDGRPRVATYQVPALGGAWDPADNGTYTVAMQAGQVSDTSDNFVPAGALGTFLVIIDNTAPTATVAVADVTLGGDTTYTFTVTYSDNVAIDVSDLDNADIRVTGPAGYNQLATFVSVNVSSDGKPRVATYQINAPGGAWDGADNGPYTVAMQASQVSDTSENFVPAGALGTFAVNIDGIAPTATVTVADVTLGGGPTHTFTVTYSDNVAIDVSDLDGADVKVTGPNGFMQLATLLGVNLSDDGTPRVATYQITAPGNTWDSADNGTYGVSMQMNAVSDTSENFVAFGTLGLFTVNAASPVASVTVSPASVTEDDAPSFTFTCTRPPGTSGAIAIDFALGGTASATSDYDVVGAGVFDPATGLGTVVIPAGQPDAALLVDPRADATLEPDETVVLQVLQGKSTAVGLIEDDERSGPDTDGDGVPDEVEADAPNLGDGNQDGVQDGTQANVASLLNPLTGTYVTWAVPLPRVLRHVAITPNPSPDDAPADIDFVHGFLGLTVRNVVPGATVAVEVFVHNSTALNAWYRYGPSTAYPAAHWYPFLYDGQSGAEILAAGRYLVHLVDGGRGDDDLQPNGVIVDPGAPGANNRPHPWQNPESRFDVNGDWVVAPLDVLELIKDLNARPSRKLAVPPVPPDLPLVFLDVNGDNAVTPQDVLDVINDLNANGPHEAPPSGVATVPQAAGEGEAVGPGQPGRLTVPPLDLAPASAAVGTDRGFGQPAGSGIETAGRAGSSGSPAAARVLMPAAAAPTAHPPATDAGDTAAARDVGDWEAAVNALLGEWDWLGPDRLR